MTSFALLLAKRADIDAQSKELDKQLALARRGERKAVVEQIKALMADAGLTIDDLAPSSKSKQAKQSKSPSISGARPPGSRTSSLAGQKLPPRYRNPSTGETWTGRGLRPRWLQTAIDQGKTVEDFKI